MKPELEAVPDNVPAVVIHNGRLLAIVGGTRRWQPWEVRWWGFSILGDIVILERNWPGFIDVTADEIHRPCHRHIVPQVIRFAWRAAFELGRHIDDQQLLEMNDSDKVLSF